MQLPTDRYSWGYYKKEKRKQRFKKGVKVRVLGTWNLELGPTTQKIQKRSLSRTYRGRRTNIFKVRKIPFSFLAWTPCMCACWIIGMKWKGFLKEKKKVLILGQLLSVRREVGFALVFYFFYRPLRPWLPTKNVWAIQVYLPVRPYTDGGGEKTFSADSVCVLVDHVVLVLALVDVLVNVVLHEVKSKMK